MKMLFYLELIKFVKFGPLKITSTAKFPFEIVHLDVTGPFRTSEEGYQY